MVFAIASSIVAMQVGFRSLDLARGTTLASQILQSEIENVRLMAWEDIITLPATVDLIEELKSRPAGEPLDYVETELVKRFQSVTRTVQPVPGAPDMRQIVITAVWTTRDGHLHTRSTATHYCRNGLNDFFATDPTR